MTLLHSLGEYLPSSSEIDSFEVGYMEGRRQIKRWIVSDEDVEDMYYNAPNDEREILLWCDGKDVSRKRKCMDERIAENCLPKCSNVVNSSHEEEVEDLTQELSSAHGNKYSYAQYKLWARMIINKQHSDRDHPPNIPMIMEPEKKKNFIVVSWHGVNSKFKTPVELKMALLHSLGGISASKLRN